MSGFVPSNDKLPVHACLPQITTAVASSVPVVLKAPPGAGKTTAVPPALLTSAVAGDGQILLIEPRRLAARAAASRLSKILGGRLGETVGYHVRFDKCVSSQTRLIAMTSGMLLRRFFTDPLLENVSCVLLDEFHERSLEVDLALGMLQRIRTTLRPELKLLVMSATLDPAPIVSFLGDATAVTSEGRSYPVDIRYQDALTREPIDQRVARVLTEALRTSSGHILIFLPGIGEIRRTRRTIERSGLSQDCLVYELYGDLPAGEQDAVLAESLQRKIILATNVAETSVTIAGVTCVIDSGQARVMRFDPRIGLPKLQLEAISQASADQRAGRAGRTAPGIAYRLWPLAAHRARRPSDAPEIERGDFSEAMLTLAGWGEREVDEFPWLTPPPPDAVHSASLLLSRLDAIDQSGSLTSLGREMLTLPLHPRLSRFMVEAHRLEIVEDAALVAGMLTERDPFRSGGTHAIASEHGCDVLDRAARLRSTSQDDNDLDRNAVKQIRRVADRIARLTAILPQQRLDTTDAAAVRMARALLTAYPDRVARRRGSDSDRGVMVGGRGVRLHHHSSARSSELFLCIDVDAADTEALVRTASPVSATWLDPRLIREIDEPFFSPALQAVVNRRRRYYLDLMLAETPIACQPSDHVAAILLGEARGRLATVFPIKDQAVERFVQRVRFLNSHMPELELPPLDDNAIDDVLALLCQDRTSIAELQSAPWSDHLRARYDYSQLQLIDKHAPAALALPSGNSATIQYASGKPAMEARIQELFGWCETPRVAAGRVAIQLHLLGPNYRPQQITEDLASFWKQTYAVIRKELRRRYPKHNWPEDPQTATATRNGLKPK
ncbi:MAG: ATP-dependent helicase HrpB [Planctomycetaceae bacterium]